MCSGGAQRTSVHKVYTSTFIKWVWKRWGKVLNEIYQQRTSWVGMSSFLMGVIIHPRNFLSCLCNFGAYTHCSFFGTDICSLLTCSRVRNGVESTFVWVHLSGHSYSGTPNSHPLNFLRFLLLTASAISVFGAFLEVYHIFCSNVYSHTLDLWFPSSILNSYLPGIYLVSYPLRCLLFFFFS